MSFYLIYFLKDQNFRLVDLILSWAFLRVEFPSPLLVGFGWNYACALGIRDIVHAFETIFQSSNHLQPLMTTTRKLLIRNSAEKKQELLQNLSIFRFKLPISAPAQCYAKLNSVLHPGGSQFPQARDGLGVGERHHHGGGPWLGQVHRGGGRGGACRWWKRGCYTCSWGKWKTCAFWVCFSQWT